MSGVSQSSLSQERANREIALGRAIAIVYISAQNVNLEAIKAVGVAMEKPTPAMCFGFNQTMERSEYETRANLEGLVEDKAAMLWRHLSKDENASWHPRNASDKRIFRTPNPCVHCHQDLRRHSRDTQACPLSGQVLGGKPLFSTTQSFELGEQRSFHRRQTDNS